MVWARCRPFGIEYVAGRNKKRNQNNGYSAYNEGKPTKDQTELPWVLTLFF